MILSLDIPAAKSLSISLIDGLFSLSYPSIGTVPLTSIVFSVIVPVLSTHKTFTLAKVSIHFISCTRTFFDASRTTLTTNATLASKYKPSGIIPITAATIEVMLLLNDAFANINCCPKSNNPIGIIIIPTTPTNLSKTRIISDCSS